MDRAPDPTIADVDMDPGDDVDEGEVAPGEPVLDIPDEPDETEGEDWVEEKDVTPDMSADDAVADEEGAPSA